MPNRKAGGSMPQTTSGISREKGFDRGAGTVTGGANYHLHTTSP